MKIGLVSYHKEPNYGTMLQAYALAQAVRMAGRDCEYVNYLHVKKRSRLETLLRKAARICRGVFKKGVKGEFDFFYERPFRGTLDAFRRFHTRHIPLSERVYYADNVREANKDYAFFIVGSDQTWSRYMNRLPGTINFLHFVEGPGRKKSYAPSIGTLHLTEEYKERLRTELASFADISCRERPNCELLHSLLGREVHYVLDPTLLLGPRDWDKIAPPRLVQGGYILAYILGTKACVSDFAEALGRAKGLPVYYIATRPEYLSKERALADIGPSEFVALVRDAAYVVTDSFHGTLFSINYHVDFYSFAKRSAGKDALVCDNDRISSFLEELDLGNRFREDCDTGFDEEIDFGRVDAKLDALRDQSWHYLKHITA